MIVAVGAAQLPSDDLPPGAESGQALTAAELLAAGQNEVPGSALVFDEVGGYEAIGAAEFLLERGASVTFVTPLAGFAPEMMGIGVGVPALERLQGSGRFKLLTQARIGSVAADRAMIASEAGWPELEVGAETLVVATARRPDPALIEGWIDWIARLRWSATRRVRDFFRLPSPPAMPRREICREGDRGWTNGLNSRPCR